MTGKPDDGIFRSFRKTHKGLKQFKHDPSFFRCLWGSTRCQMCDNIVDVQAEFVGEN